MRTLLASAALLLCATAASAVEITYPKDDCATILGSDIPTPGSDSSYYIFEMHCVNAKGAHVVFLTNSATASAFIGFGRASAPTRITLIPGNVSRLVVNQ